MTTVRKQSKLSRYMKGSFKILARARDFYVQGLTGCAADAGYVNPMGFPATHFGTLPRSFSAGEYSSSRDEDFRELIRIASTCSLPEKVEGNGGGVAAMKRSRTVAIGRIDEDKPCEFGRDDDGVKPVAYSRSGSYGSASRRSGYVRIC